MVRETSTGFAPWTLVEAESKRYARVKVIETVIAAAEDGMRRHGIEVPPGHSERVDGGRPSGPCRGRGPSDLASRLCLCGPSSRRRCGRAGAPSAASAWRRAR